MRVRLSPAERSGDIALRVRNLVAGYDPDHPILQIPELEVRRGQRLAVVGANGAGKTTLVRSILGELAPLSGEIRPGAKIEIGYLPQGHDYLDGSLSVLDVVQQASPESKPGAYQRNQCYFPDIHGLPYHGFGVEYLLDFPECCFNQFRHNFHNLLTSFERACPH